MSTKSKTKIALTGATGFLGQHILEALVGAGFQVRALTRKSQDPRPSVEWIKGDLSDVASLAALAKNAKVMIHAAGLTKARSRTEFFRVNRDGTERVLKACRDADIKKFILISSLAAREPQLSHYAASKSVAENLVLKREWPFKTLVLRPPGIYGPKDLEILKILKSTRYGFLPAPGSRKNRFSMIHAQDLANAIVATIKARSFGAKTPREIDDMQDGGYTMDNVAEALAVATDTKHPKIITVPHLILQAAGGINLLASQITQSAPMLTPAKANELTHSDWVVSSASRHAPKDWTPEHDLASGLKNTIEWYRKEELL